MKIKKFLALSTAMAVALSTSQTAFAQEMPDNSESEYLEYHYQVNFDDLDVFVVGGKTLDIASNGGRSMDAETMEAVDALLSSLAECSEVENEIVDMLNDNKQLAAISFTIAPLVFNEDHFDRVRAVDARDYKDTDNELEHGSAGDGNFTLYTSVYRPSSPNADGTYEYTTVTHGAWSKNSFIGGYKYPADGEDFVLQTTPNTWMRTSNYMYAHYDNSPEIGVSGKDFRLVKGDPSYLQYAICDDPYEFATARQNKSFSMACTSNGDASTSARMIQSYYVHTWAGMSISVSIAISTRREVILNITPEITEQSWQLYNYLSFDF